MPTLSDRFSAYPVSVTLNGSGDGTIQFQAVGKNIRVTNLYVSVSTRTLQAVCTMYKGQIGAQYAIKSTNSGSTGAAATGSIDLLDGESIYVVWDGGDAGAIATATFTGVALPFSHTPEAGTSFLWDDPIAAGDGSLIYPGLQSIDYVAGVSGWRIERDGDVEFNDGVFRGSISAGGGVVTLDSTGVTVQSTNTLEIYKVNRTGGFVAARVPDDGSKVQISAAGVFLTPQNPSPLGVDVDYAEWYVIYDNSGAANETPVAIFSGVEYNGKTSPTIELWGQRADDANPDSTSQTHITADDIHFHVGSTQPSYQRGEYGSLTLSFGPAASATVVVNYAKTYTTAPFVDVNIDSGAGSTARWISRAIARTTTGFTFFVFSGDAVANTWVNIPLSWVATEQH